MNVNRTLLPLVMLLIPSKACASGPLNNILIGFFDNMVVTVSNFFGYTLLAIVGVALVLFLISKLDDSEDGLGVIALRGSLSLAVPVITIASVGVGLIVILLLLRSFVV